VEHILSNSRLLQGQFSLRIVFDVFSGKRKLYKININTKDIILLKFKKQISVQWVTRNIDDFEENSENHPFTV
jgi:hypothetical protein